ncbi:MAG: RICIN domain-containing protein [Minicystis sp.]
MNRARLRGLVASFVLCLSPFTIGCLAAVDPDAAESAPAAAEDTGVAAQGISTPLTARLRTQSSGLGRCVDVHGASTADGARVDQWDCVEQDNERFYLRRTTDGYYNIVAKHSGKCLDIYAVSTADGASLVQWTCNGGDNQKFRFHYIDDNTYEIIPKHSGKCLDVTGWGIPQGAEIQQWPCGGVANQLFYLDLEGRSVAEKDACKAGIDASQCTPYVEAYSTRPYTNCIYGLHVGAYYGSTSSRYYDAIDLCAYYHDNDCWDYNPRSGVLETGYMCSATVNFMACVANVVPQSREEADAKECIMHSQLASAASICDPFGWGSWYTLYDGSWGTNDVDCKSAMPAF